MMYQNLFFIKSTNAVENNITNAQLKCFKLYSSSSSTHSSFLAFFEGLPLGFPVGTYFSLLFPSLDFGRPRFPVGVEVFDILAFGSSMISSSVAFGRPRGLPVGT